MTINAKAVLAAYCEVQETLGVIEQHVEAQAVQGKEFLKRLAKLEGEREEWKEEREKLLRTQRMLGRGADPGLGGAQCDAWEVIGRQELQRLQATEVGKGPVGIGFDPADAERAVKEMQEIIQDGTVTGRAGEL